MNAERAPVTAVLWLILLPAAALLLEGCGECGFLTYENPVSNGCSGSFQDKSGHDVWVSTIWPCGGKEPPVYYCLPKDRPPEDDGYVRQQQHYIYEGAKPLECPAEGAPYHIDGVAADTLEGMNLEGTCTEDYASDYAVCNPHLCRSMTQWHINHTVHKFNESLNGIPLSPDIRRRCCIEENNLTDEGDNGTVPNASTLYVVSGTSQPGVVMATGAVAVAGTVTAAVIGLLVFTRRLRASSATASHQAPMYSGESDIE